MKTAIIPSFHLMFAFAFLSAGRVAQAQTSTNSAATNATPAAIQGVTTSDPRWQRLDMKLRYFGFTNAVTDKGPAAPERNAGRASASASAQTTVSISEVGPDHRVWSITSAAPPQANVAASPAPTYRSSATGWPSHQPSVPTNQALPFAGKPTRVVEMASGMNYFDGQQWSPSNPSFQVSTDGTYCVASQVQHKITLAANLNSAPAVSVAMDGLVLNSTPVAIGLYDSASGNSTVIATITNCSGVLTSSNKVLYQNAFNGVSGDVVYTLECGSFSQDIVFTARLDPATYGFPTNTTRIQIISEFYDPPQPDVMTHPIYVEPDPGVRNAMASPDLIDQVFGWNRLTMGTGHAFATGSSGHNTGVNAPVVKELRAVGGRTFLIESVVYSAIQDQLASLAANNLKPPPSRSKPTKGLSAVGYAAIPRPPAAGRSARSKLTQLAQATSIQRAGVVIDYELTIGPGLTTPTVFAGDTTFFCSGPVYCAGPTTIEGGAIFKYPNDTTAFIQVSSVLTLQTTAYLPAIFTAGDDDYFGVSMVGIWDHYSGIISTTTLYANPALNISYVPTVALSNIRICHAQEAVLVAENNSTSVTISDSQFVNCVLGIVLSGPGTGSGSGGGGKGGSQCGSTGYLATINNCLMAHVNNPISILTPLTVNAYNCTFDGGQYVVEASGVPATCVNVNCYNSIFSNNQYLSLNCNPWGANNGFYLSPGFGTSQSSDTQPPYAPTGFVDPTSGAWEDYVVNGQGAYYLRDQSPFASVGTTNIAPSLQADLATRTTMLPSYFFEDVDSSLTLSPLPIRDTGTPDLGYHYPAVDYVVVLASVTSATLSIDQGTVLAFTDPWLGWGIRVNPGGRLIVNGVPTNRVTFARLDAVQESPDGAGLTFTPFITFKGVIGPIGPVLPLAEARISYADFPALAEPSEPDPMLGTSVPVPLMQIGAIYGDETYECETNLIIDGCVFTGGEVDYSSGGPPGRNLTIRNSVFDRSQARLDQYWPISETTYAEAQLTAANNLFHGCSFGINPAFGDTWTFIDNIFDNCSFYTLFGTTTLANGPVGVNNHNAYVGMQARLSPTAPTTTDPDISSLAYSTGALGRFYLPRNATAVIGQGSRTAAAAGLYHFTTDAVGNTKEAAGQVDIGPSYVALANGAPADYDSDGIPDFVENRLGDGLVHPTESNWQIANTGTPAIVNPVNGATVGGIIQLTISLGAEGPNVQSINALVDGNDIEGSTRVSNPAASLASIEIDTTWLGNGSHTISISENHRTDTGSFASGTTGVYMSSYEVDSPAISVTVANPVSFPNWEDMADLAVDVNLQAPVSLPNYNLFFFDSTYPFNPNPLPINPTISGGTLGGTLSYSDSPQNTFSGNSVGEIYSVTELQSADLSTGTTVVNKNATLDPTFPSVGLWTVFYGDDSLDSVRTNMPPINGIIPHYPILDRQPYFPNDPSDTRRWGHDLGQGYWVSAGNLATGNAGVYYATPNSNSKDQQTWPLRNLQPEKQPGDYQMLQTFLSYASSRNAYGFLDEAYWDKITATGHRYRFVFFDGCSTSSRQALLRDFGEDTLDGSNRHAQGAPDTTVTSTSGYSGKKIPAAFLSWNSPVPVALNINALSSVLGGLSAPQMDPVTQKSCYFMTYEAMCNWHSVLLQNWAVRPGTLLQTAINNANDGAVRYFGPYDVQLPNFLFSIPVGATAAGNAITFDPNVNLVVNGYIYLTSTQFNQAGDTW